MGACFIQRLLRTIATYAVVITVVTHSKAPILGNEVEYSDQWETTARNPATSLDA